MTKSSGVTPVHATHLLCYSMTSVKEYRLCTDSGDRLFRYFITTLPAVENTRSDEADVAGTAR